MYHHQSYITKSFSVKDPVAVALLFLTLLLGAGIQPGYGASPDLVTAIVDVAKKNIPAVVHIEVTERKEVPNPLLPFERDPFFRHFFGNRKMPKKHQEEIRGLGSGMLMDSQGNILTSYHVAGGATKIEVQLIERQQVSCQARGRRSENRFGGHPHQRSRALAGRFLW